MENFTYDKMDKMLENLAYIGLDLDNIPVNLKETQDLKYSILRGYDDTTYKIYKYIPIDKIQILFTEALREDDLKTRYAESRPLIQYIIPNEDEKEKKDTFLKIIEELDREEIEKTEREQENLKESVPFRIKFKENYLWQIYYSAVSDKFFMLFPTKNFNSSKMLYLLKEQLKNENEYIYAPVACLDYTEEALSKLEILDLENYLMNFTGYWPQVYEVFDKENHCSLCISGDANVYDGIVLKYKIVLENKEKALEFFKLTKALFIMQSDMYIKYKFNARLGRDNSLEFWYGNIRITYDYLHKFISEEYNKISVKTSEQEDELVELNTKIQELKKDCFKKEREYFYKEKEIATFLKYRKTFFGKIRYYFKSRKKKSKEEAQEEYQGDVNEIKLENSERVISVEFYTLDELKMADKNLGIREKAANSIKSDIKSLEIKILNLGKKIENAKIYIEEIDENSKSIFDFWKFTNKDTVSLPEGKEETIEDANFKLQKLFVFEDTFEEFSQNMDALLRTEFTIEELNTLLIFKECEIISNDINLMKNLNKCEDIGFETIEERLQVSLNELKSKIKEEENKLGVRNFDVFGNIMENQSESKILNGKKHRENRKSVYKALNISENTTLEEYKDKLQKYAEIIKNAINKVNIDYDMVIYKSYNSHDDFKKKGYELYSLNVNEALKENKKILIRLDIKNYLNAVPYTNIVFYTDINKTLPIGMDCGEDMLVDNDNLKFEIINKREIIINNYDSKDVDTYMAETESIEVCEYKVY